MINYKKLNRAIITKSTLDAIFRDKDNINITLVGSTPWLNRYRIERKDGGVSCLY